MNTTTHLVGIVLLPLLAFASAAFAQERGSHRPKLQILNGSAQTADVFWLKNEAERVANGTVAPGKARDEKANGKKTVIEREVREVSGWKVHINKALLDSQRDETEHALVLLKKMLGEIIRVVPAKAVLELQKVPLYFSPPYKGKRGGAEFHPDAGWLRDNGRDPVMAKGVEFSGVADFEAEMNRMPNFALHELAHAYHNRVIAGSFDNAEIKTAYEHAKASGKYEKVERWHGNGRPNTFERAYAMTNPMEYFAHARN